jgi:ribose transport system substrate-binding protein
MRSLSRMRSVLAVGAALTGLLALTTVASGAGGMGAKVNADVAAASKKQTNKPPSSGPKAVNGKTILVLPCSMGAEGCARPARAAMEAAKAIGWKATLIDPQGNPATMQSAIQKAISSGTDGIALEAIDASTILGALQQAKAKGIVLTCFACVNAQGVYDNVIPSEASFSKDGYTMAEAAYKLTGGRPNFIMMDDDEFGVVKLRRLGTEKFIKDCGSACKLVAKQNFLVTELTTRAPTLAVSAARSNSSYNVFWAGYDAALNFMVQGLRQANLTDKKKFAVGFDANVANLDDIRNKGFQKASVGSPMQWIGYAEIDTMNRVFAKQKPVDEGVHSKLLFASNLPKSGPWDGDLDVRPSYRKIWGK